MDFGDGNTSALTLPTLHVCGVKTVTLTVTDNDGLTDTDTLSVTVTATNPVAVITAPSSAFNNTSVSFSSASSTGLSYLTLGTLVMVALLHQLIPRIRTRLLERTLLR